MIPDGLQEAEDEMVNWSRWSHQEQIGPQDVPPPSIWDAWLSRHGRVAGWGLTLAEQEAESRGEVIELAQDIGPPPIDEAKAERTEANMRRLMDSDPRTYVALREHYYRWVRVPDLELHAALRRYQDSCKTP